MDKSNIIKGSIVLYSILIFLLSFLTGKSIDDNWFRWISGTMSAVILAWAAYDNWIWRQGVFKKITQLFRIPVLHGTWKGVLKYEKDKSGKGGEVDVYVAISQTFTSVSVRSYFKKPSESRSIVAKIEKEDPNRKNLVYVYKSEAPYGKRDNNRPHDGACVLNIVGNPVKKLSGSYFTERKGAGIIMLYKHSDLLAENFEDAEQLEYT